MKHSRKRSNIVPLSLDPRSTNALKYKPEYCQLIIRRAKLGEFPEQWCSRIDISLSTMYNWANRYQEFDRASQLAWTHLTSYWTQAAWKAALGGPANTQVLIHILKKRFPDTWGHSARNTQASFPTSYGPEPKPRTSRPSDDLDGPSLEELEQELAELRQRNNI
ncbi:hypothetical protein [Roseovarius aestuarii]|uniref:Uncharacterized protein n=1 Tax=Roseovarius aestuarii TaxID=475083 RepID=A0A1X7BYB7_9RHOB|nr:hypothetical protein [Roseovarius aestuarii]SMC14706.1 hypothetical protein ROA7745_04576 [Roseovarius aestuarii]